MPELSFQFLMQVSAELDDSQVVGETPLGARRILVITRGSFSGPGVQGQVLPGGGDWVLLRRDGVAQLDIRITLRTDDAALIYVSCIGISDITPEVRERIRRGEAVDPAQYYFRTALTFETGAERYRRLNRLLATGVGKRTATGMVTDVFALR